MKAGGVRAAVGALTINEDHRGPVHTVHKVFKKLKGENRKATNLAGCDKRDTLF